MSARAPSSIAPAGSIAPSRRTGRRSTAGSNGTKATRRSAGASRIPTVATRPSPTRTRRRRPRTSARRTAPSDLEHRGFERHEGHASFGWGVTYPYGGYATQPYAYAAPTPAYFCPTYGAYYPNVASCPVPWVAVTP